MSARQRAQVVELLRCAADESLAVDWAPMANLVDVARALWMYPFDIDDHTRVLIAAWRRSERVWRECVLTWPYALLEAAARVEEGGG